MKINITEVLFFSFSTLGPSCTFLFGDLCSRALECRPGVYIEISVKFVIIYVSFGKLLNLSQIFICKMRLIIVSTHRYSVGLS